MDKCYSEHDREAWAEEAAFGNFSAALNASGRAIHFNICGDSPAPYR